MGRLTQPGAFSVADNLIPLILSERPTAYYVGKDIVGSTLSDRSGNGFDLTANGAPNPNSRILMPFDRDGLYLDLPTGANSYILTPNPIPVPVANSWSVIAIVCPLDFTEAINLFTICGSGETEAANFQVDARLFTGTGEFQSFWESGAGVDRVQQSGLSMVLGTTVALACVKDANAQNVTFYKNGLRGPSVSYAIEPTGGTSAGMAVGDARAASLSGANIIGHIGFFNNNVLSADFIAEIARSAGLYGASP